MMLEQQEPSCHHIWLTDIVIILPTMHSSCILCVHFRSTTMPTQLLCLFSETHYHMICISLKSRLVVSVLGFSWGVLLDLLEKK